MYHNIDTYSGTFDFDKHYKLLATKYRQFLKDFELEGYVDLKFNYGVNNCTVCHYRPDEPMAHKQAKNKIFKLFLRHTGYLVETEVSAKKNKGELQVFDIGKRGYQLDVLAINVENLMVLFKHVDGSEKVSNEYLNFIEHDMMFAVELDGDIHSWKKDRIRDLFFLEEYNIVTVRYDVADLVDMYKRARGKYATKRHMKNYSKEVSEAYLNNITIDQIILDVKALYYKKYRELLPFNKDQRSRFKM